MAQRHALGMQRFLQRRAIDARFGGRGFRNGIDLAHAIHARKIERDDGAERAVAALTPPTTLVPPPIGHDRDAVLAGEGKRGQNFRFAARIEHRIGRDRKIAGAQAQQVVIGTAARMEGALVSVVAHAIGAEDRRKSLTFGGD